MYQRYSSYDEKKDTGVFTIGLTSYKILGAAALCVIGVVSQQMYVKNMMLEQNIQMQQQFDHKLDSAIQILKASNEDQMQHNKRMLSFVNKKVDQVQQDVDGFKTMNGLENGAETRLS